MEILALNVLDHLNHLRLLIIQENNEIANGTKCLIEMVTERGFDASQWGLPKGKGGIGGPGRA